MKLIGLLDCNNFFVSCERLFRPDLRKRPTVVLSSNDGVVVARSQEVKDLGIPMGSPYFKVRDELQANKVAVFSSNFQLYSDISHRVMEVLKREVGEIEQYSVDEAFFIIDDKESRIEDFLRKIRECILKEIGVPVSLGAGKTMTIAKYASEREKKKSGVCVLVGKSWQKITPEVAVSEIWGIGGQTSAKMRQHGIATVADLLSADRARVEKLFGVHGLRLRSELSETPAHDIHERHGLQKSIMSTRSFAKATTSLSVLEDAVAYHVGEAGKELREIGGRAKSLRVLIRTSRHGDYFLRGGSDEVILPEATSDTRILLREALTLTQKLYQPDTPYKKAGVVLGHIEDASYKQFDLFQGEEEKGAAQILMRTVDSLNQKLGKDVVTIGRVRGAGAWKPSREHSSPRYTTNWSELASVKA
mgnify:CR=1 FL=1